MKPGPFLNILIPLLVGTTALGQAESTVPAPVPQQPVSPAEPSPARVITPEEQKELDGCVEWQKSYYRSPQPERLTAVYRRKAELGALSGGDQGWTEASFAAEVLKSNPSKTADWCRELADLSEPARGWWWTAVWMSQTPEANAALAEYAAKPEGDPARIVYSWIGQKPQDILARPIRGTQQLAMLWAAFCATGTDAYLVKTFEVIPDPDLSDPKLSDRAKERRTKVTEAARFQLGSAAHADAPLMTRLRTLAASAPEPQKTAVLAVLDSPPITPPEDSRPGLPPTTPTPADPK